AKPAGSRTWSSSRSESNRSTTSSGISIRRWPPPPKPDPTAGSCLHDDNAPPGPPSPTARSSSVRACRCTRSQHSNVTPPMWFKRTREELARAQSAIDALNADTLELERQLADAEAAREAVKAELAALQDKHQADQSPFESISRFGQSVGDIKNSFLGLVQNLDGQRVAVTDAAGTAQDNRATFTAIAT